MKLGDDNNEDVLRLRTMYRLLGSVPPTLREVSVELKKTEIAFRCYFTDDASEEDLELLGCAATELISDYPAPFTLNDEYIKTPAPRPLNRLRHLVFARHENAT